MIGYYNPSVILTYTGLIFAVLGIVQAANGNIKAALIFLMLCGLCDMFDGSIAKLVKRNDNEKQFGIQIDSLCDLVCFAVFPAVICYFADKEKRARHLHGIYILGQSFASPTSTLWHRVSRRDYAACPHFRRRILSACGSCCPRCSISIRQCFEHTAFSHVGGFYRGCGIKKIHKLRQDIIIIMGVPILAGVLLYGNKLN
jgi:hypothetical protein